VNRTRQILAVLALASLTVWCAPAERAGAAAPAFIAIPGVSGPALPLTAPGEVGVSAEGVARIAAAMQALVDDGRLPGVMTLISRKGKIAHWNAFGMRDIASGDPLEPDDVFRIYSMTKPITSTAIMMLVESGDIALEDPVSKFIPSFLNLTVLEEDGSRSPVARPMTIGHLLSHTGGLTYGFFGNTPVDQMYLEEKLFESESLEAAIAKLAGLPLVAHPGEQFTYSISTDVLGYLVQIVSGQPFEQFLHGRIFEPLSMDDTAFWVPTEKRGRFMSHYSASDEGFQVVDSAQDGTYTQMPSMASGGGGLVSTASDYIRFAQMLLQEGQLDGVRILQPETVLAMRTNQLAGGATLANIGMPGYGFGLGFATLIDEDATAITDHNGVFRWGGYANTFFWIDPEAELIAMVWTQLSPFGAHDLPAQFQTLVYEALGDS
jgi:CubicO group peptidase (beta-lactamase class C family)